MSHEITTYTLLCSFWVEDQAEKGTEAPAHGSLAAVACGYVNDGLLYSRADEAAHDLFVESTAEFVERWLAKYSEQDERFVISGFTASKTWGGGPSWPRERGVQLVLAGLTPAHEYGVHQLAAALRDREHQDAVAVLTRNEEFALI